MKRGNTFVNSTKDGVARVRQGGFAYLTDEPYLDYYNMKDPCDTMMLKNLLEAKSYGIGLQRYSDLTNQFSVAILEVSFLMTKHSALGVAEKKRDPVCMTCMTASCLHCRTFNHNVVY